MLRALVEAASRFDLPPHGYEQGEIRWVLEIDTRDYGASLVPFEKGDLKRFRPTRGDRSGTVSEDNLKAALLVDKASYALGMRPDRSLDCHCLEYCAFRKLIENLKSEMSDSETSHILTFLDHLHEDSAKALELRAKISREVKPGDVVAFRAESATFPFESTSAQSFWKTFLAAEYRLPEERYCSCCGGFGPVLRILPSQVSFAGYSCPIASFNAPAFDSFGRTQTANSPLCFACASQSSRVLQHLLNSESHHRQLIRDQSKGTGKTPLRNQWAVFWLKEPLPSVDGIEPLDLEALFASPLDPPAAAEGSAASPEHVRKLYELPFSSSARALHLDQNRFYIAVLSPNKSRLVLREWIDESAAHVVETLAAYDAARTIQDAYGIDHWHPNIPAMLDSLKPFKSTSGCADANLVRSLLRAAYRGMAPPTKLLDMAVLRFRVPDRPKDKREKDELQSRRQTLAAVIKFVLSYGKKEAITLQSLDNSFRSAPYLCGRLLAALEEAQLRASRWSVKATLVDRFYGGASTSPQATLGLLVRQGTIAHMPKIRKIGAGYRDLEQVLETVMAAIDEEGGFPTTLTLKQQGEFALGFYHQRAFFSAAKPNKETSNQEKV